MRHVDRFSDRAADYALYRPTYPQALIDLLRDRGLGSDSRVMDAGSGTGILTELLLRQGATVFAVEPNAPMREEAERRLTAYPGFVSINGTAENTTLPDLSIHIITAAQAFHWFDVESTRAEWQRILVPEGLVALIWNERVDQGAFSLEYGAMARTFVECQGGARARLAEPDAMMRSFFGREPELHQFANHQDLDLDGVIGRALSSSYWPKEGPAYEESIRALHALFDKHSDNGFVRIDCLTQVFLGPLLRG